MAATTRAELLGQIQGLIRQYFETDAEQKFVPGETVVSLMLPSYSWQEVNQAVESLLTGYITLNQTTSSKVGQFEEAWSRYVGTRNGIMVNSGSSANLLALFALANPMTPGKINPGDEVITPAVTWHTTVSPIIAVGAVPVLIDVRLRDFAIDVDAIEAAITPRTRVIMPVHLLGNPCPMDAILDIANRHGLHVVEDTCEAHGATFKGRRCGSFGRLGTFSFFFSHHITTMEGGMVMTDDDDLAELLRIMRSQGVIRNARRRAALAAAYKAQAAYREIDESYLFANLGFNLRPTELNGGFGLEQIKKLDGFLARREENGRYWIKRLDRYRDVLHLPEESSEGRAWFCFPVIVKPDAPFMREQLAGHLNACKIETRPIMAGNIAEQPALAFLPHHRSSLSNAAVIHRNGFFWGNHQGIDAPRREYVADCVDRFMAKVGCS